MLPDNVTIVEIEPERDEYGLEFSPVVAARSSDAIELVKKEAAMH